MQTIILIGFMIAVNCAEPRLTFHEFFFKQYPGLEHSQYGWGFPGETYEQTFLREMDAIADYADYVERYRDAYR